MKQQLIMDDPVATHQLRGFRVVIQRERSARRSNQSGRPRRNNPGTSARVEEPVARLELQRRHDRRVQRRRRHVESVSLDGRRRDAPRLDADRGRQERRRQKLAARQAEEQKLERARDVDAAEEDLDEEAVGRVPDEGVRETDLLVGAALLLCGCGAALVPAGEAPLAEPLDQGVDRGQLEGGARQRSFRDQRGAAKRARGVALLGGGPPLEAQGAEGVAADGDGARGEEKLAAHAADEIPRDDDGGGSERVVFGAKRVVDGDDGIGVVLIIIVIIRRSGRIGKLLLLMLLLT